MTDICNICEELSFGYLIAEYERKATTILSEKKER